MNKAYKFRLYPNKQQEELINKTFGCVRFVYNRMLADKIKHYEETKQMLNNTPAQYKKEFEWLKEVDSLALANAQMNIQTSYNNFFRDTKVGFPKFKCKKKDKNSYTTNNVNNSIRIIDESHIILPKLKSTKIKIHREIGVNEKIKSCNISKTSSGKYYISILVEYDEEIIQKKVINESQVVGLDFSMHDFYYSSEDKKANYPRYYRNTQEKLTKEQRRLSKKKRGSNNYYKQKVKVAKIHEKIANQRKDWLHKESRILINNFDAIILEDLNMKNMSQCLHFGKSVHDNGWGMFTVFLQYKANLEGKQVIKINKWYPSSKTCSNCGNIKTDLKLSDRIYECDCGLIINRDYNASINIKRVGITQLAW